MTYEEEAAERIKPHIGEYRCLAFQNAIVPYSHGYVDGRKESEQEINRLNGEIKEIIEDNDYYQHENAELQQRNDAQAESIANYMRSIEKLNEKIKGLEAGEVAWQGDIDAAIMQNFELKNEIDELIALHESDQKAIETIMKQWEAERNELKAQIEELTCSKKYNTIASDGTTVPCFMTKLCSVCQYKELAE